MDCGQFWKAVYEYQTLITGMLAVIAAVCTILATTASERNRLKRQSNAARVTLPLTLSGVGAWSQALAKQMMDAIARANPDGTVDQAVLTALKLPDPPSDHVTGLRLMIEATDDEKVINRISKMVGGIQVLTTRLGDIEDPNLSISRHDLNGHLIDAAIIWAQAGSMFNFARRKEASVPAKITWDEVRSALKLWLCYGMAFDRMYATVDQYEAANPDPEHDSAFGVPPPH